MNFPSEKKKPLTIGLVIPYDLSIPGGVLRHSITLSQELRKLGVNIIYFSPTSHPLPKVTHHVRIGRSLRVPNLNGSWSEISLTSKSTEQIAEIIRNKKIDILHFQEIIIPLVSWQILKASSVPNVVTFHSGWNKDSTVESLQSFFRSTRNFLKEKISASIASPVAAKCNRNLIIKPIHILPPLVDIDSFAKKLPIPKEIKKTKINLLFVGRLDLRKGCRYLVESLARLDLKTREKIHLNIIGSEPIGNKIQRMSVSLGISHLISFLGALPEEKKIAFFQHSDIYISPATGGESFGMVLIEAMAAGIPIIAGNNDAYRDTLKDYPWQEGIINPRKTDKFTLVLKKIIDDRKLREKLSQWEKIYVKNFDPAKIAKKHLQIYRSILK